MIERRVTIIGITTILAFSLPFIFIAIFNWIKAGFGDIKDYMFIFNLIACCGIIGTIFHLYSQLKYLEGSIKKFLFLMDITFIIILIPWLFNLINSTSTILEQPSLSFFINHAIPTVSFYALGIQNPNLLVTIPADSLIIFIFILLGISCYLYPMEKYSKQTFPWHTLSMLIGLSMIPFFYLLYPLYGSDFILSIGTVAVILVTVYNFFYLFYLYLITGLKAKKGSPMRKASIMIGFALLFMLLTWIVGWAIRIIFLDIIATIFFAGSALFLFNFGFYTISLKPRTAKKNEVSLDEAKISLIETLTATRPAKISEEEVLYYRNQQICLVCKGQVRGYNNFLCDCKAIYCEKCARALEKMENACWVCGGPFDNTKPIKKIEEDDQQIQLEMPQDIHKKKT